MDKKSSGLLISLSFIWALYYIFSQKLVIAVTPFPSGFLIRLLTFFVLMAVALVRRHVGELKPPPFRVMRYLILIGVLGFLLDFTAFLGLKVSSAGGGTILLKTDVLMAAIISAIVFRQRFTLRDIGAIVMMFCGVLLTMDVFSASFSGWGDIFFLLSALFVTMNAFVIRHVLHLPDIRVTGLTVAFYNNFYVMVLFLVAILVGGDLPLLAGFFGDTSHWGIAVAAGLGQSLVYLFYNAALDRQPVWTVKVFLLLMPVFTTLIEIGMEYFSTGAVHIPWFRICGMVLVLLGALLLLLKKAESGAERSQ